MSEYDEIAKKYQQDAETRNDRKYIFIPTIKHYLGDIKGKKVLDLACGFGFFTRLLKMQGAARVVGIDVSKKMIDLAKEYEKRTSLGIEYCVRNVASLGKIDEFDIVFAGFLLHYAATLEELQAMCRSIFINLKRKAYFFSFNENPFNPLTNSKKYGHTVEPTEPGPLLDGTKNIRTHYVNGEKTISYTTFHYTPNAYKNILTRVGFSSIEWLPFVKSAEADTDFSPGYWDNYINNYCISVLRCQK